MSGAQSKLDSASSRVTPHKLYSVSAKANEAAEIYLYADIGSSWFSDGVTAKQFATDLKALGAVKRIDVRINSYGGDVAEGLAIYRLLADHGARIITHVDGVAASIASAIAMAGKEIKVAESASMMVHEALGGMAGTAGEFESYARVMRHHNELLAKVYASRSGQTVEQVKEWMTAEAANLGTWFDAETAVKAGLATEVVENVKMAASATAGVGVQFTSLAAARSAWAERQQKAHRIDADKRQPYDGVAIAEATRRARARLESKELRKIERSSVA